MSANHDARCRVCKKKLRDGDHVVPVQRWHTQQHNEPNDGIPVGWVHLTHLVNESIAAKAGRDRAGARGTLVAPPSPSEDAVHLPVTPAVPRNDDGSPLWVYLRGSERWHAVSGVRGRVYLTPCGWEIRMDAVSKPLMEHRPDGGACPACTKAVREGAL